ncbi:hypothetical protein CC78DRAFT_46169 [Lojkania enalia]|uniref:DUF6590 domain-containing protein n=1 Tax=Lojkania enalia TaxID=147567 RepID=A0A9P4KJ19_9PLEO|nr:hypothetical protein CC78DRAFT_46169 [Didymosphaeria enalia]
MSDYSPWIWSAEHQRHYCYRHDENGNIQYLWSGVTQSQPDTTPSESTAQEPTRTSPRYPGTTPQDIRYTPNSSINQNTSPTSPQGDYTYAIPSRSPAHPRPIPAPNPLPDTVQQSIGGINNPRRYIRTAQDNNDTEVLDPSYKRVAAHHHYAFFKRGRVFKMLWIEPAGRNNPGRSRGSTHFSTVRFGESAFSEIRRFVIIQNKGSFSQCIPIQTYRKQGATKPGLNVQDHGIIFTDGEQLEPESRINFGKPYAVEHNCKVMDIGVVADEHMYLLVNYFYQSMGVT